MFTKKKTKELKNIGVIYEEYENEFGTKHAHFKSNQIDKVFLVGFETIPVTDNGAPHILEHIVLSGSKNFNVAQMFNEMEKRSLATYMNASTATAQTEYKFATNDKKDYFNLMDVYLDAVFYPNIEKEMFQQEGWRLSVDEKNRLEYKGVVFNEMKGALDSKQSQIYKAFKKHLKNGTIYQAFAGGDPLVIPELTHEDLIKFHKEFYNPKKAVFTTWGNFEAKEVHDFLEEKVFSKYDDSYWIQSNKKVQKKLKIKKDFSKTEFLEVTGNNTEASTVLVNWQLDDSHDTLMDYIMFEHLFLNDGCVFSNELDGVFGRFNGFSGVLEDYQNSFHIGMSDVKKEDCDKLIAKIDEILNVLKNQEIEHKYIQATLDELELYVKKKSDVPYEFALDIMSNMVEKTLNGKDFVLELSKKENIAKVTERFKNPEHTKMLAENLLSKFPRKVLIFNENPNLNQEITNTLKASLEEKEKTLDLNIIKSENEQLENFQKKAINPELLPKINVSDISREVVKDVDLFSTFDGVVNSVVSTGGIDYFNVFIDCSGFTHQELPALSFLAKNMMLLPSLDKKWEDAVLERNLISSKLDMSLRFFEKINSNTEGLLVANLSFYMLDRLSHKSIDAVKEGWFNVSVDDADRVQILLKNQISKIKENFANLSIGFTRINSGVGLSLKNALAYQMDGLGFYDFIMGLERMFNSGKSEEAISLLRNVLNKLKKSPYMLQAISSEYKKSLMLDLNHQLNAFNQNTIKNFDFKMFKGFSDEKVFNHKYILTNNNVNYCYQNVKTNIHYENNYALNILCNLFETEFAHKKIREENGAYGAYANMNELNGIMTLSSYRDPMLEKTYSVFDNFENWVKSNKFSEKELENSKLNALKGFEKTFMPEMLAEKTLVRKIMGVTEESRLNEKEKIIDLSLSKLNQIKEEMKVEQISKSASIHQEAEREAKSIGFEKIDV